MKLTAGILLAALLSGLAGPALAMDKADLNNQIGKLTAQFEVMQQNPDTRIAAATLRDVKGIVLLNLTKGGFMFAFQSGGGVAMVKDPSGVWSPAAFVRFSQGSFGFQAGGQQGFYALLMMTTNATHQLAESQFKSGGEARGTAGNSSSGVNSHFCSPAHAMRVYADRSGFFGGVAFTGGKISYDRNANEVYYDRFVTLNDILFAGKVSRTEAAKELAQKISVYSEN